jgi:hypothetical protein
MSGVRPELGRAETPAGRKTRIVLSCGSTVKNKFVLLREQDSKEAGAEFPG